MTADVALARACDDERRRRGLTQADLARQLGCSQPSVCMALAGHRDRRTLLSRIAEHLGIAEAGS